MKNYLILGLILFILFSCKKEPHFTIEGTIEHAEGQMLVLEHVSLNNTYAIDSLVLKENGKYELTGIRPEYPDFYSLRLGNRSIRFSVDSTETIVINSDADKFVTGYTVSGSYNSEHIRLLRLSVINLQKEINLIDDEQEADKLQAQIDEIQQELDMHKSLAQKIILENPRSTAAYFAIYQQINNTYMFSPYVVEDYPYCAAVATAYHTFMPEYDRSKSLYNYVLGALKARQQQKQQEALSELIQREAKGYIDIALPDRSGNVRSLSELEGKVILIDFFSYEVEESIDYTFLLRDLYNKYNKKGFEIYQVSLDRNRLLWDISTENLPWICVRDEKGPDTNYATLYNISKVPSNFIMDKEGIIVARDLSFNDLDKEIGKLIK